MNPKVCHTPSLAHCWLALGCLLLLVSCGGGSASSTPPIAVSVSPAAASVPVNSTQQFTATVTGASNTAVNWSVAGVAGGNSTVGAISPAGVYTAPSSVPSPATVSASATAQADPTRSGAATVTVVAAAINQKAQSFPIELGTTGGNVNDVSAKFCCSGTLGSLVSRGGSQFILSNNHALARSDQATAGEAISQPGLVDNNCNPGNTVAILTQFAPLKTSNVDAAIAAAVPGAVDPSGAILEFGSTNSQPAPPANTAVAAAIGMPVAKSGRSTALTCSSIGTVNATVQIDYQTSCNSGTTFTVTFNNQVIVNSGTFSAAGDSGSLIVNSQTAQPVALLFGGNSATTVGNPILAVLTALKDPASGAMPSIVGGGQHAIACPATGAAPASAVSVAEAQATRATAAKNRHEAELIADPAVIAVGVAASDDNPEEAAVVIYVDRQKAHAPIPVAIDGVRTKVIATDRFHATVNNPPSSEQTRAQVGEALPDSEVARATAVKEKHVIELMSHPSVIGVGIGQSEDDRSSAALVIYVDKSRAYGPIPTQIAGVRTKVVQTDRFRSFGWGEPTAAPAACPAEPNPHFETNDSIPSFSSHSKAKERLATTACVVPKGNRFRAQ